MAINAKNLEILLTTSQSQLDLTFQASDALDTKALGILGFDIAVSIFTLQVKIESPQLLLILFFVAFILSGTCTVAVIWPRNYLGAAVDLDKRPEYLTMTNTKLLLKLLANTEKAINCNDGHNNHKSVLCTLAIIGSLLGTGLLAGCIL